MSYAEHGPRIFLTGRPSSGVPLTYGDYVLPRKRSEGRLKLYNSCTDIRAWSPNVLESTRYFRELNEHDGSTVRFPREIFLFFFLFKKCALGVSSRRSLRKEKKNRFIFEFYVAVRANDSEIFRTSDFEIWTVIGDGKISVISLLFVQLGKLIPFSVVMENMIALTAQAQCELRVARRELQRYRSLNLTPEQQDHLENFVSLLSALNRSTE